MTEKKPNDYQFFRIKLDDDKNNRLDDIFGVKPTNEGRLDDIFRDLERNNSLGLDVLAALRDLGMARVMGALYLTDARNKSAFGYVLTDKEFQRVLAYNGIRDLKESDITAENVGDYLGAISYLTDDLISYLTDELHSIPDVYNLGLGRYNSNNEKQDILGLLDKKERIPFPLMDRKPRHDDNLIPEAEERDPTEHEHQLIYEIKRNIFKGSCWNSC